MTPLVFVDVDVQRDFCDAAGALAVPGAPNDAFRKIVAWAIARGAPILGSVDSHAHDAWEFASSGNVGPAGESPRFPDHCVKGTAGWLKVDGTLPPRFRFVPNVAGVDVAPLAAEILDGRTQGLYFEKEVYSLFANPNAAALVRLVQGGIAKRDGQAPRFAVFGVATDYCVRAAARGLREHGCSVVVIEDAIAGIDPARSHATIDELEAIGVAHATTADLGIA